MTQKMTSSSLGAGFQPPDLTELGITFVALSGATDIHRTGQQLELKSERQEKEEDFWTAWPPPAHTWYKITVFIPDTSEHFWESTIKASNTSKSVFFT